MCSNAAESFNNWVSDAQHLSITRLVDMVKGQIMEQMAESRVKCTKWAGVICPKIEKKLAKAYNDSRPWRNIHESIDRTFHIDTFKASYNGTIYPIPIVEKSSATPANYMITPPTVKRPPGRPKRKRIPSRGEVVQGIRCGRCEMLGNHNRKTCKEPI
ncbi:hypothetical protein ACSBR2_041483 [Camellia fascicularis]